MSTSLIADLMERGLELHRKGDLEQAGRVYGEILSVHPEQADALHLLGIVSHQQGDHVASVRAIAWAIALRPSVADFHAHIGEVYRALGQFSRAAACRLLASRLRPDHGEAWQHGDSLRPKIPFEPVGEARMIGPGPGLDHTNLANGLLARGNMAGAIDHFFLAVQHAPNLGEAHSNLGRALFEVRRLREALFHCGEAVRLAPDLAPAWNHLGNVLRELGRTTEAKANYVEALRIDPNLAVAHLNLGRAVQDDGWLNDAAIWFRIGLALDPDSVEIRWSLANALEAAGRLSEAAEVCEGALGLDPESAEALVCLGSVRHEQGQLDEATRHFLRAIRARPDCMPAHCSLGVVRKQMGDLEAAERSFRDVLRLPVDHSRALNELAKLLRGKLPLEDIDAIDRLISSPELPETRRAELHLASAEVLDARGDHARAADNVRRGKGIKLAETVRAGREYHPEEYDQFVEEMISTCSPEFFARAEGFGLATGRPVFILGLPRSGTTLTEQILAAHSRVHGAGELKLAQSSFESLPAVMGLTSPPEKCLGRIDRVTADRLARNHLAGLGEIARDAPLVADKMPENFHFLGLLAVLFPWARFIHCRRDLRDVAVSCWFTNFRDVRWTNHPDHIAAKFAAYRRLMDHWAETRPVPVLEVDYEQTVADLEGTARRLVDWCGLDWEPECLAFHESRNPIRTASATQIRQPIYSRSVGRWRNYETELGPLFERLERLNPADWNYPARLAAIV